MSEQKRFTFGDPETYPETVKPMPKQIAHMHYHYGKSEGETCGYCDNCYAVTMAHTYYKCRCYYESSGPATDWRLKWAACGLWRAREEVQPC